ncbi:hypothetical protein HY408_01855 [Candidatus Gottesmanbacteria bacterium]|nr:hypothetical protein [Candidatus Gottesmanbacteria bacterium]
MHELFTKEYSPELGYTSSHGPGDPPPFNALYLVTSRRGHKYDAAKNLLIGSGYGDIPIGSAYPNLYEETDYNSCSGAPHIVAAIKILQRVGGNWKSMFKGQFQIEEPTYPEGVSLMMASDVMLDTPADSRSKARWETHNKPPPESTPEEIYARLVDTFCVNPFFGVSGYLPFLEARIRVGLAAFCLEHERGVAGVKEHFIHFTPLTEDELFLYVYGVRRADALGRTASVAHFHELFYYEVLTEKEQERLMNGIPVDVLGHSNLGWQWEHPIVRRHVQSVDGVNRVDDVYIEKMRRFFESIKGAPRQLSKLVKDAFRFSQSKSRGNLTPDVAQVVSHFSQIDTAGTWDTWYPR